MKSLFQNPHCIGVLGGRPNHAIYFVGYHTKENVLYGLDPHTVFSNPSGDIIYDSSIFPSDDYIHQIHVKDFVTLDIKQLDPSLAIAFYFQNRQEFNTFCSQTRTHNDRLRQRKLSPLYQIEHTAPSYMLDDFMDSPNSSSPPSPKSSSQKSSNTLSQRNVAAAAKALQSMGIQDDDDFQERRNSEDRDDEYVFL